jgi:tetratricopeptide (TPR) repeat protein
MKNNPSSPEERVSQALMDYQEGRLEEAARCFAELRQHYLTQGEQAMAAEMANNMAVVLLRMGQHQEALDVLHGTPEIFLSQSDRARAAQAYGNIGAALEACGNRTEAERAYRQATDLFEALGDSDQRALTLQALSKLQLQGGRPFEALSSMQTGLDIKRRPSLRDRLIRRLLNLPNRLLRS